MNGQTEEIDKKVKSEPDKIKEIKTPESKPSKKKQKTPRKETKVEFDYCNLIWIVGHKCDFAETVVQFNLKPCMETQMW